MSFLSIDLWVVLPYIVILLFFGVPIYRYLTNKYSFTSYSAELLEKRFQGVFSYLWHYGTILVILGHIVGLLVPESLYEAFNISFEMHYIMAMAVGGASGVAALIGLIGLTYRRFFSKRVRAATRREYYVVYVLFYAVILLGLYNTLYYQIFLGPYNYVKTVGAWLQGVLALRPDPAPIIQAPITYQIHVLLAMIFLAIFPFTFLVHMWVGLFNIVSYLLRPRIIYRSRRAEIVIPRRSLT